ncbi:MAG: VOC family protein [Deltaproteobacteria bacterium]|nr:VOC family protein [Deltaproteobacteria bacterium]MBW2071646.1 VOC family protein [Deltaproteobacteria bacterium]
MESYIHPGEQLVVVFYVVDIRESSEFYLGYGFETVRDEGSFMELKWEESRLFLVELPDAPPPPPQPIGNMRIMVPDVDEYWRRAREKRATILRPIGDRAYGLRDFIIAGPDGLALRFATRLEDVRG